MMPCGFDEFGPLELVLLRRPEQAFVDAVQIDRQWRSLNYPARPKPAKGDQ